MIKLFELSEASSDQVVAGSQRIPLLMICNPRARRYLLRLHDDGTARVTIPRGGSATAARQFVEHNSSWLEKQFYRLQSQPRRAVAWNIGMEILFRGDTARLESGEAGIIHFGGESVKASGSKVNLRLTIEQHLWKLAARELPPRVLELAGLHRLTVQRISVRNQKSRWGSCSRRGTISLNWRLIQTPPFVQNYICLHELMHLREMNHSARFWREVERACPDYREAEAWLKQHSGRLR